MVPVSMSSALRRFLDSGGGEGEDEASGVGTSKPNSSSGGLDDWEVTDLRGRLEEGGFVSRV